MLDVQASTVLGATQAASLEASNSIFDGMVVVERRQIGCTRFCYLPFESLAPQRYRCQPADAASAGRIFPTYASTTYGEADYGQLAAQLTLRSALAPEDEGEMGLFTFCKRRSGSKTYA
ncbi:MAG: hypothetical protein IPM84_20335 [Anaerolineae bacterium]|nr:hypothetical protein [Anaerolineae bacterium]